MFGKRTKPNNCKIGRPCGLGCVPKNHNCKRTLKGTASIAAQWLTHVTTKITRSPSQLRGSSAITKPTTQSIKPQSAARPVSGVQTLKAIEDKIAYDTVESAIAFDKTGKILFRKNGSESAVNFSSSELKQLEGAIVTHNHPIRTGADTSGLDKNNPLHQQTYNEMVQAGQDIGLSFSAEDIALFSTYRLKEIRAVTPNYTYRMKPPTNGWDGLSWEKQILPLYEKHVKRLSDLFQKGVKNKTIENPGEYAIKLNHMIWTAVAKETGMIYTVEKIKREKHDRHTEKRSSKQEQYT